MINEIKYNSLKKINNLNSNDKEYSYRDDDLAIDYNATKKLLQFHYKENLYFKKTIIGVNRATEICINISNAIRTLEKYEVINFQCMEQW